MYTIQTLNKISLKGLELFPRDSYEIATEISNPDAILVRSYDMLSMELPKNLKAIARAGAGVNNIPVEKCTERGIVVFNTPGANANAVKNLFSHHCLCHPAKYTKVFPGFSPQRQRK